MMETGRVLNELPCGWSWTKLEFMADKINPGFPSGKHNKENRGIPHIRPMNISPKGEIDLSNVKYVETSEYDSLLKGDDLFNNTNSPEMLGKTTYLKKDTSWAYSNHMTRIRLFQQYFEPAYVSYYLHHLFLSGFFKMNCVHHVNQASINSGFLSQKIPIPLAPLPEQHRIVAKIEELFSHLDAGVDALQKAKAQLQRYRQSVLKAAVEGRLTEEWRKAHPEIELDETFNQIQPIPPSISSVLPELPESWNWFYFAQLINGSQNGISKRKSDEGDPVHVLRLVDIVDYKISQKNPRDIKLTAEEVNRYRIQEGDLLCIRVNGSKNLVGRMIAFSNNDEWAFCDHFIRFKLNKELVLSSYLSNYFSTKIARDYIKFNMVSSAGQNTISQKTLASLPIALPCITEQEAIVKEFDRLSSISEATVNTLEDSFKFSDRLRQSILKCAFEGRLVPQDLNDEPASMLLERIKAERFSQVHKSSKRERPSSTHQMRLIQ